MAENDSPEGLSKKWFVLAAMGAAIYFTVVFAYVIRDNDKLLEQDVPAEDAKVEHHD